MPSYCLCLRHYLCSPSCLPAHHRATAPFAHPCWAEASAFIPALCICSQASSEYICRAARRRWLPPSEIKHWIISPAPKLSCCASHPASPPPQPAPLKQKPERSFQLDKVKTGDDSCGFHSPSFSPMSLTNTTVKVGIITCQIRSAAVGEVSA